MADIRVPVYSLGPEGPAAVAVTAGFHGNETNGILIATSLVRALAHAEESLASRVLVLPCTNPLALDSTRRSWPLEESDLYDSFGVGSAGLTGRLAEGLISIVEDAGVLLDLHASNMYIREAPHVRFYEHLEEPIIHDRGERFVELATALGFRFSIRKTRVDVQDGSDAVREIAGSAGSIFAVHLEKRAEAGKNRIYPLIVICGSALRVNKRNCLQVLLAIGRLLNHLGVIASRDYERALDDSGVTGALRYETRDVPGALEGPVATSKQFEAIRAQHGGLFLSDLRPGDDVDEDRVVGTLLPLDPESPPVVVTARESGIVAALRVFPAVAQGGLLARILPESVTFLP